MDRSEFDKLCKQDKEWERFDKEILECADNVLPRDRIIEILPKNLIEFAFSEWREKGVNMYSKEYVFSTQIVELRPTTLAEIQEDYKRRYC